MHELLVDMDREDFCEKICQVVGTIAPDDDEMTLLHSILDPMEPHVHCFGLLRLDSLVGEANSGRIVTVDGGGVLGVAEGGKDSTVYFTQTSVHKEGGVLGFSGGGADNGNEAAHSEERSVDMERLVVVA